MSNEAALYPHYAAMLVLPVPNVVKVQMQEHTPIRERVMGHCSLYQLCKEDMVACVIIGQLRKS